MKTTLASLPPPKKSRIQFTDEQARELLAACEQSGLPATVFARQRGIGVHHLYAWKRRLRKANAASAFVPVRVTASERPTEKAQPLHDAIEIHGTGVMVRVIGHVHTEQLRSVMEVLGVLPC